MVGDTKFSVPFGINRAIASVGAVILAFPYVLTWFRKRWESTRSNKMALTDIDPEPK